MGQKQTLFFTATEGRLDDLKWVLYEKKVSPNLRDHETQEVALHLAASRGHAECVKLLLKAGANVDARNYHGLTALHLAVCDGKTLCVRELINGGADVNATSRFGCFPLHQASFFGCLECCQALLEAGAWVDVQEAWGRTPLSLAVEKSNSDIMLLLLQYNANVHIPGKLKNQSPLLLAASLGKVDCMRVLLDNNADPNYQDIFGHTPLHYVANEGSASQTEVCIRLLVAYGARGDMKDNKGQTPIDVFINKNRAAAKMLTTLTCKPRSLRRLCWVQVRKDLQSRTQNLEELGIPRSVVHFIEDDLAFLETG